MMACPLFRRTCNELGQRPAVNISETQVEQFESELVAYPTRSKWGRNLRCNMKCWEHTAQGFGWPPSKIFGQLLNFKNIRPTVKI